MATQPDDYFYDRAEAELKRAQQAEHPAAVRAHYLLAGHYLDRFYGPPAEGAGTSGAAKTSGQDPN
jgi:hypothetical protein